MTEFYIPNTVDGLASVLDGCGYFDEITYEAEPVDCLRTTHFTKAGTTVDIAERRSVGGAGLIYIDGITTGTGGSSSEHVTQYVGGFATDNGIVLSPVIGTSYPSERPEAGGRASLIICETENDTTCFVFPHRNGSSIYGQVPSGNGAIELDVVAIDTNGVKTVWKQVYYMYTNDDNVIYSSPIVTGKEIIKDVTICLNRCFGGKEGPFMTTIQNETYLSVARNGFLIKTT